MKKIIYTEKAPVPVGPYSQAILSDNTLYVSGQIALNPENGERITSSIEAQTQQVMKNLNAVLEAADMDFTNDVKATIFITDISDFAKINTVYGSYFPTIGAPARETVQVSGLPKNVDVEVSVIS